MEAATQEEARQALIWEEAARASSLAAEAAKLVAAHALVDAREPEHRMVVHAAMSLKVEQDKELARHQATKVAAAVVAHKEQVLATAKGTKCLAHCKTRPHTPAGITGAARSPRMKRSGLLLWLKRQRRTRGDGGSKRGYKGSGIFTSCRNKDSLRRQQRREGW